MSANQSLKLNVFRMGCLKHVMHAYDPAPSPKGPLTLRQRGWSDIILITTIMLHQAKDNFSEDEKAL